MNKAPFLILKIFVCSAVIGTLSLLAVVISKTSGSENGFTETLLNFIDVNARKTESRTLITVTENKILLHGEEKPDAAFEYEKGDWSKYVIDPRYSIMESRIPGGDIYLLNADETNMNTYGSYKFDTIYGGSAFTSNKYRRSDDDKPVSRVLKNGLDFERQMQLHMEGNMGRRMKVYIDYDSEKENNHYVMQYRAKDEDELVREINAGEIDIKFDGSKYAVYDDTSSKGLGLDMTLQKKNLKVKAFGSIIQGETEIEIFRGGSSAGDTRLNDYQYVKNTYFQLEPFKRYDNLSSPPALGPGYNSLITFTSSPFNPETYRPFVVNISTSGFELHMDDQNPYNNLNSAKLDLDGGYYDKLVSGSDYTLNYSTGLITFLKSIPRNARIFAVYTLAGGGTSDPAVSTSVANFNGKNFVFIKYGYSINTDLNRNFLTNPDKNNLNLDIYEVRSIFNIGQQQILENNFRLQFFKQNGIMPRDDQLKTGLYSIDYSNGLILFYLREPFRKLYVDESGDSVIANILYSENQPVTANNYSKYNIRADYYREAKTFQLKHPNIIPGSVRIRINGRELAASLYSVDYTSGFLQFTSPVMGQESEIEVKYEYLPLGGQTSSLVTGLRTEYKINKNLKIGGTVLFSRDAASEVIPKVGSEPQQTLVLEGDSSLYMAENSLKDLVKAITGYSAVSIPLEIFGYAEYAKSYRKVNTFGKALIDDMESNEEVIPVSLSDKDWQLSSMLYNINQGDIAQSDRGFLTYYYYKDPGNPSTLKGPGFNAYKITNKQGPYNIATGHVADAIQSLNTQKSLVFNFDFSSGNYIPVVTRNLSQEAADFSQLQYLEIWYRAEGTPGEQVQLYFDIGSLNEDSNGNGNLDTEDINNNGILDFDPARNYSEDIGFVFDSDTRIGSGPGLNSFTVGDGILNSEDLNHNGTLDTIETRIRLPGPATDVSMLTINMGDSAWKKARIYLNKSSADYKANSSSYEEILKKVQSIRLYLQKGSTATTGTVYIDSIKFISTIWGNLMVGDVPGNSPDKFKLTLVDTINDPDYRANSFMLTQKGTYNSLYGNKSDSELALQKETAIQIDYNFGGSASKKFSKTMDIRSYKTMNIWMNFRSFQPGDNVALLVGSSDRDYLEYRFQMDYPGTWREMKLKLKGNSGGNVGLYAVHGSPDLKRISFMRVDVYGQAGSFWLDDIYLSDPETQTDSAYWYEGELKIKKPLYYTDEGTPLFSDIDLKYIRKGHGAQFNTIGKPVSDISEDFNEVFTSMNILPNWNSKFDFIMEKSDTDSFNELVPENKRGKTEKKSLLYESGFLSSTYAVPSIKFMYKQDIYNNSKVEDSFTKYIKKIKDNIYTPSVILDEKLSGFLWGNLSSTLKIDLFFMKEKINRTNTGDLTLDDEKEKRQKGSALITFDYQNKYFFIQPGAAAGSHEIVEAKGKKNFNDTQLLNDVGGGFHFPFLIDESNKLVDREKKANLRLGLAERLPLAPNINTEFFYAENNFRDYVAGEGLLADGFSRSKSARSSVTNGFNIPFNLSGFKYSGFLKTLNFYYSRSVFFQETGVPYEGENTGAFEEKYGIKRVYNGFSGPVINLIKFPPWYFFRGRGNFGNGRDFAYNTLNKKPPDLSDSSTEAYGNQLRLIDNAGFSTLFDFELLILNFSGSINQVSERQSLYGIPQEVVTFTINSNLNLDLMQIFSFSFFRPNRIGLPHHSANINIGYDFVRNMIITSNIEENTHSPNIGLTFKRDRSSIGIKTELDYRFRNNKEYISLDETDPGRKDYIYVFNMQTKEPFKENDKGYKFSILYETDVLWLYNLFSKLYTLTGFPIFSIEYSMILNRYDYSKTTSPEPFDQHLVTGKITLDLHKNVQGGITGRMALERFRDRETNDVNREIRSYEISLNFSLIF